MQQEDTIFFFLSFYLKIGYADYLISYNVLNLLDIQIRDCYAATSLYIYLLKIGTEEYVIHSFYLGPTTVY